MESINNFQEKRSLYAPITQPELGNLIKENRKAKKMSQRQLGELLGVSYQTIANWENGLRVPIPLNLMRLAQALDKPTDFFFCSVPEQQVEPVISTLSDNLRSYRKQRGISQVQLSGKTGISLVKIKGYEDENSGLFITNENLQKLCEFFCAKPEDLLGNSSTYEELQMRAKNVYLDEINRTITELNLLGLQKAAERIKEIAEIKRYRQ